MTDTSTEPTTTADDDGIVREVEHDPEVDGELSDGVELVRTGVIRLVIGGSRTVLRRPFFGEFKRLRLSLEAATDSITDVRIDVEALAAELHDEQQRIADDDKLGHRERAAAVMELRKRDREAGRKLTSVAEDARVEWWADVFDVLGAKQPDDWPSWIADATLPDRIIRHWRSAPLGRG
jgi:hypothetical protein